eukprot:scaffold3334_cov369-Prasinococcus_capsulatus_cf.AAC.4
MKRWGHTSQGWPMRPASRCNCCCRPIHSSCMSASTFASCAEDAQGRGTGGSAPNDVGGAASS